MAPRNVGSDTVPLTPGEENHTAIEAVVTEETHSQKRPPMQIVWRNVFWLAYLHAIAIFGIYCLFYCRWSTLLWTLIIYCLNGCGITAGAHRLWAHRSYKAKMPFRIFLAIFNTMAFQNDIIEWVRDHRVHHKYSETDADPHNAKRGFFFAHVGWLLVRKHPEVKEKGRAIDINDLYCDPVLAFQRRFYLPGVLLFCFFIPAFIPWYFFSENIVNAFCVCAVLRYIATLNSTWLVNSAAHLWGNRPYDRHINPSENLFVSFSAVGEGFHNYHHTFPSDYSTSEWGWKVNLTTALIDFGAAIGQVTERKRPNTDVVLKRRLRTGDGSHSFNILGQSYPEPQDTDKEKSS